MRDEPPEPTVRKKEPTSRAGPTAGTSPNWLRNSVVIRFGKTPCDSQTGAPYFSKRRFLSERRRRTDRAPHSRVRSGRKQHPQKEHRPIVRRERPDAADNRTRTQKPSRFAPAASRAAAPTLRTPFPGKKTSPHDITEEHAPHSGLSRRKGQSSRSPPVLPYDPGPDRLRLVTAKEGPERPFPAPHDAPAIERRPSGVRCFGRGGELFLQPFARTRIFSLFL